MIVQSLQESIRGATYLPKPKVAPAKKQTQRKEKNKNGVQSLLEVAVPLTGNGDNLVNSILSDKPSTESHHVSYQSMRNRSIRRDRRQSISDPLVSECMDDLPLLDASNTIFTPDRNPVQKRKRGEGVIQKEEKMLAKKAKEKLLQHSDKTALDQSKSLGIDD